MGLDIAREMLFYTGQGKVGQAACEVPDIREHLGLMRC